VVFTNQSTGDYDTCAWDFGDGKSSNKCDPMHTYKFSGQFTVMLTVSGLGGNDTMAKPLFINVELGHLYLPLVASQAEHPSLPGFHEYGSPPEDRPLVRIGGR
jgi:PKD repeat protein